MPALLAWLAGTVASFFASKTAEALALKIILTALFMVILPIVLNNVFYDIMESLLTAANEKVGDTGTTSAVLQLSGLAAFLASHLRLPEALSIIITGVTTKVTLRLIPFVRVVN
jgi:hypothetical protein